jgi:hypothetical protein
VALPFLVPDVIRARRDGVDAAILPGELPDLEIQRGAAVLAGAVAFGPLPSLPPELLPGGRRRRRRRLLLSLLLLL